MQVILKADVDHLGYAGDVVEVKKGYWRNFLRPRSMAETATSGRVADMTAKMERRRAAEARNETEAHELRDLLNRTVLTISAQAGPQGKLFGSVGSADIAKAIDTARKLRIDAKRVKLDEPIRALGTFMVSIEVFSGVTAEVKTMVVAAAVDEDAVAEVHPDAAAELAGEEPKAAAPEADASETTAGDDAGTEGDATGASDGEAADAAPAEASE